MKSPRKSPRRRRISPRRSPRKSPRKKSPKKTLLIEQQIRAIPETNYYIDFTEEHGKQWADLKHILKEYEMNPSPEAYESVKEYLSYVKYAPSKLVEEIEDLERATPETWKEIYSLFWIFENIDLSFEVGDAEYTCKDIMAIGGQGIIFNAKSAGGKECVVKMSVDPKELKEEMGKLKEFKGVKGIVKPISPLITFETDETLVYACVFPKYGPSLSHLYKYEEFEFNKDFIDWSIKQLKSTLNKIHDREVIHLDIHPSNILLGPYDRRKKTYEPALYIIDFGISCKFDSEFVGDIGVVKYSSPFIGERVPTYKDDYVSLIYSMCFLHQGNLPWMDVEDFYEARKMKIAFLDDRMYAYIPSLTRLV